jgi:uncharacterized phage protein (TIGR02220 family)
MINRRIAKSDRLATLRRDRSRVLYFMIYPHSDCEGRFSGDVRDIKEDCVPRLPYTHSQIEESLIELHEVGLINLYVVDGERYMDIYRFDDFQKGMHKERESASEIPANPELVRSSPELVRSSPAKVPLNLKFKSKFKVNINVEQKALVQKILTYFNEVTGQKRKSDSEGFISGRLDEGRTFKDFKHVIDTKTAKWRGKTWTDKRTGETVQGDDFIRPSTFFRKGNFEDYLNEPYQSPTPPKGNDGRPPKTDAEKEQDRLIQKAIDDYSKKAWAAATPKIDAARKANDLAKAKAISEATAEKVEKFANKVWRGEA